MKQANKLTDQLRIGFGVLVAAGLTGCVGYVGGGYGGAVVVAPGPDLYLFGGGYERGHDVHEYSRRGAESHAVAHPAHGREERH